MNIDKQVISNANTAAVGRFANELKDAAKTKDGIALDSTSAIEFVNELESSNGTVEVPKALQATLDSVSDNEKKLIIKATLDGINSYEQQHGIEAPADIIEQAIQSAYSTTPEGMATAALDSTATSNASAALGLQPNRAVVAILSTMSEAIPFAHYLPADIKSNEAILAIMSHVSGSAYGGYAEGGLMDGSLSGDSFITSSRIDLAVSATGAHTGALTTIQSDYQTCDAGAATVKLLRGRSIVYVNGEVVAKEVDTTGTGNSTVSGSITISGTTYQIGGTINTDTGVYALTSTPALANGIPVIVEGFIDYERAPELTPSIITAVDTYKLHAKPWRVITQQTIDSRTQMANELGLDPYSESVIAIQSQHSNERHYEVLAKASRLAENNTATFDFAFATRGNALTQSMIWQDFASKIGEVSQQMALDTLNHGVTHLYVGAKIAAQLLGLPREVFTPSGTTGKPCVYRLGRLFGLYEVYYTPKIVAEGATSGDVLCIGRATDVTRNPFILGDAVAPTVMPLTMGTDMKQGAAFYSRSFTSVNPHKQSSLGCAKISITNLG